MNNYNFLKLVVNNNNNNNNNNNKIKRLLIFARYIIQKSINLNKSQQNDYYFILLNEINENASSCIVFIYIYVKRKKDVGMKKSN